jgi:hypothetical protein
MDDNNRFLSTTVIVFDNNGLDLSIVQEVWINGNKLSKVGERSETGRN